MARQGRGMALLALVAFGLVAFASATEYPVADGWVIPPTATYYSDWLADKSFVPGDVLVFQYTAGSHSVFEVSKSSYDTCDTTSPISTHVAGNDKVTLGKAGTHYFICGVPTHCSEGNQKITIVVTAAAPVGSPPKNSTAPATPKAAPVPAKAPEESGASGLHAAGALVLSVVMVFLASLVL